MTGEKYRYKSTVLINGMHFEHSNAERGVENQKTGKVEVYKVCDICGAVQKSNNGFTVEYKMPGAWGKERHGYCAKCANRLVPALIEALDKISEKEKKMRREK